MKRHDALVPLSHDHQHALAQALRLRRAADLPECGRPAVVADFLRFVEDELETHFDQEEQLMLRATAVSGDAMVAAAGRRIAAEHVALRGRIAHLYATADCPAPELLRGTGRALHDHVRLEEREVFDLLQRVLGDGLAQLAPRGPERVDA